MQAVRPGKHAAGGIRESATIWRPRFRIADATCPPGARCTDSRNGPRYFAGTGGIDSCGVAVRCAVLWTIVYA